jgi:ribosomal protein S6
MKNYEMVAVIDANLSSTDMQKAREDIEKLLGKSIKEIDEIWLMPLAYPLLGQDQAYFVSYFTQIEPKSIDELKSELKLIKGLAKFSFFAMSNHETFLTMAQLAKKRTDLQPEESEEEESEEGIA